MVCFFYISKFKFQNGLKLKTCFATKKSVEDKPPKTCTNIIADSESFKKYRDFGTWMGSWSKWNYGVITCWHIYLTNLLIAWKPSYVFYFCLELTLLWNNWYATNNYLYCVLLTTRS